MRFRLRTLLIVLALGPPLLAGAWFGWLACREQQPQKQSVDWMTVTPGFVTLVEEEGRLGIELPYE